MIEKSRTKMVDKEQESFGNMKQVMMDQIMPYYLNPTENFEVFTDTCYYQIDGGIISKIQLAVFFLEIDITAQ